MAKKSSRVPQRYIEGVEHLRKIQKLVASLSLVGLLLLGGFYALVKVKAQSSQNPSHTETSQQVLLLPERPKPPRRSTITSPFPDHTSQAFIVVDVSSRGILEELNSDQLRSPASTTKLMTALVSLEEYPLDQVITITTEDRTIGQTMKLVKGEQIKVRDLLAGLMISSGNDAALALAQSYPNGGYTGFVAAMNQKAEELGLEGRFTNVSGLESPDHKLTARDLSLIALEAIKQPLIQQLAQTKVETVYSLDGNQPHQLGNTNQLLGQVEGVIGLKTGWTEAAGECLVSLVDRNGQQVIVVVLGSQDRFKDSTAIIDWVYQSYLWE